MSGDLHRGLFIAPFDELSDPRVLVELSVAAEEHGWDGVFLWDHVVYRPPVRALADPWVALSAIASHTSSLRIGPLVTPLPRRRVQKVARETVTLDRLSRGRLVFGVGIGGDHSGELSRFGEVLAPRDRATLLDDGLKRLAAFWDGEFEPRPVQEPRIPVWVAAEWPHRRPVRRALRWDGIFPIRLPEPAALAQLAEEIRSAEEPPAPGFDVVVEVDPGDDPAPWREAGATWVLTAFGRQPRLDEVRRVIEAGP